MIYISQNVFPQRKSGKDRGPPQNGSEDIIWPTGELFLQLLPSLAPPTSIRILARMYCTKKSMLATGTTYTWPHARADSENKRGKGCDSPFLIPSSVEIKGGTRSLFLPAPADKKI